MTIIRTRVVLTALLALTAASGGFAQAQIGDAAAVHQERFALFTPGPGIDNGPRYSACSIRREAPTCPTRSEGEGGGDSDAK